MKKTQILSIAAALLAAPVLNAEMYTGWYSVGMAEPINLSVNASVYPTSGGIKLSSWWNNPFASYFVQVTVTGSTNGVRIYRTWKGVPEVSSQGFTIPLEHIKGNMNNWVRQDVWYWSPDGKYNTTNWLYHTRIEAHGSTIK